MNKKVIRKILILTIISIVSITFVYNDYFLYKNTILKITNIENENKDSIIYGSEYYNQKITGIIQNGKYKGKEITVNNTATISGVYDEKIHTRSELFVELSKDGENAIRISGIKRDKYIVILFILFIDLIFLITPVKAPKTVISLFVNILISIFSIFYFSKHYKTINMLSLYLVIAIIFIVFSLYITNGKSKKTLSAIVSAIISLFTSFGLSYFLMKIYGKDVSIWTMEYIEVVYDYKNFFYVSILLCGLGAIMDIAITIASSLNELIEKNPKITTKSLLKSGKEISKDIVGTMTNVMLYTCYTPIIPTVILAMRNNVSLSNSINMYGTLELIIVLCSCISIVMAIPISLYTSIFILKPNKEDKYD